MAMRDFVQAGRFGDGAGEEEYWERNIGN